MSTISAVRPTPERATTTEPLLTVVRASRSGPGSYSGVVSLAPCERRSSEKFLSASGASSVLACPSNTGNLAMFCRYMPRFNKRERLGFLCITHVGMHVDIGEGLPMLGALFICVGRKQQRTDGIPHADDFTQSKVSDSLLVGFLGSLETRCNSEEMRGVVHGFPKLNFEGGPHFLLHTAKPTSACFVLFRRRESAYSSYAVV